MDEAESIAGDATTGDGARDDVADDNDDDPGINVTLIREASAGAVRRSILRAAGVDVFVPEENPAGHGFGL